MRSSNRTIGDFRRLARHRLPRAIFDYLDGGVDDEQCVRRNVAAFDAFEFVPKRFRDVSVRDISTELFGERLAAPFIIGPTAFNGLLWRQGDLILAKASAAGGVPFVVSTASQETLETIAQAAPGHLWFQLYVVDRRHAERLITRAVDAGYRTLVVTVDVTSTPNRERDTRNSLSLPPALSPRLFVRGCAHPRWLVQYLTYGRRGAAHFLDADRRLDRRLSSRELDASLTWDYLKSLRDAWPRRLVVKGILDVDDALMCAQCGADAVLISNHGGRQLDAAPAPLSLLPSMADVSDRPLIVDGGVRRGSDIVKAVALGATAVGLGRAILYALAAGGLSAVEDAIALLKSDIDRTLAQLGCRSIQTVGAEYIRRRIGDAADPCGDRCTANDA
jgi:(S)-mandelate dehydrogenase